jgi:hypothetical protein
MQTATEYYVNNYFTKFIYYEGFIKLDLSQFFFSTLSIGNDAFYIKSWGLMI